MNMAHALDVKLLKALYRAGAVGEKNAVPLSRIEYQDGLRNGMKAYRLPAHQGGLRNRTAVNTVNRLLRRNVIQVNARGYYMTEEFTSSMYFRIWRIDR